MAFPFPFGFCTALGWLLAGLCMEEWLIQWEDLRSVTSLLTEAVLCPEPFAPVKGFMGAEYL